MSDSLPTEPNDDTSRMAVLRRCFLRDRFAASSGVELLDLRPGYAKARLEIEERHLNGVNVVQGGAIFTLADFAFAVACNTSGHVAVGVTMNLSVMKATRSGVLYAEAVEIARSRRISTCTVRVTDAANAQVAQFQGTAFIKDDPWPPADA
jgi:acyl-CoA thioesterase